MCPAKNQTLRYMNTFSNKFKYPHSRKSQNSFGSINIKTFYENGVSLKA